MHSEARFFWATYAGAELDLVIITDKQKLGFEVKRTSSPRVTPSIQHAIKDLKLNRLDVIHAGDESFPMKEKMRAVAMQNILKDNGRLYLLNFHPSGEPEVSICCVIKGLK